MVSTALLCAARVLDEHYKAVLPVPNLCGSFVTVKFKQGGFSNCQVALMPSTQSLYRPLCVCLRPLAFLDYYINDSGAIRCP